MPGWGQAYQEKRIQKWLYPGLFLCSLGASIYSILEYNKAIDDYDRIRQEYQQAFAPSNINHYKNEMNMSYDDIVSKEQLRNNMLAVTGGIWLWNLVDIFVLPPGYSGKAQFSRSGGGMILTVTISLDFIEEN
jgi:hypothetical protein